MKMEVIIFRTITTLMVLERFVPVTLKDLSWQFHIDKYKQKPKMIKELIVTSNILHVDQKTRNTDTDKIVHQIYLVMQVKQMLDLISI